MKALALLLFACVSLGAQSSMRTPCRPGDGILLEVQNEPTLTDTFIVTQSVSIILPQVGEVSLAGVPREELTPFLERVLARYVRRPSVRARVMLRIGVSGEVMRPGYYQVPVDAAFADVLMLAGGATKDAKMRSVSVRRGDRTVLSVEGARLAVSTNATVNQVALESGDLITVPRDRSWDAETWVRVTALLVTIPLAVITMSQAR
jgi:protein involved in polysaccharide export with SLBB domain